MAYCKSAKKSFGFLATKREIFVVPLVDFFLIESQLPFIADIGNEISTTVVTALAENYSD